MSDAGRRSTKRTGLPSASTSAAIFVFRPPRDFADGLFLSPPFCSGSMLMDPDVRSKSGSSDKALKIRSQTRFLPQRQKRV